MSIVRKPERKHEERAAAFIESAGKKQEDGQARGRTAPVMIRFDRTLLAEVDEAARKRGVSRSAWVQYTLSRALEAGEG